MRGCARASVDVRVCVRVCVCVTISINAQTARYSSSSPTADAHDTTVPFAVEDRAGPRRLMRKKATPMRCRCDDCGKGDLCEIHPNQPPILNPPLRDGVGAGWG